MSYPLTPQWLHILQLISRLPLATLNYNESDLMTPRTPKQMTGFCRLALSILMLMGISAWGFSETQPTKQETRFDAPKVLISGIDLSAIDKTVDPEEDFFRHVNGAWLNNTQIPADKSRYGLFNLLYETTQHNLKTLIQEAANSEAENGSNTQKLGDMYNSYMNLELANEKGLTPLHSLLEDIDQAENMPQLSGLFGELYVLGVGGVFNFYTSPDAKNPEVVTMYLYQGGLTLPDKDYYSRDEEKFVNFRNATETYMAQVLVKSGHKTAAEAATRIMAIEKDIAAKHLSRVESRDAEKNYNNRSAEQVKALLGPFDWQAYAKATGVDKVQNMVVRTMAYFEELESIFAAHPLQAWKDYLSFHLIDTYAPHLSESWVTLHFDFHSTALRGIPEQRPRWKRAVDATSNTLGEVLGQQYVERHFRPQAKKKIDTLVNNMLQAYAQSIEQLEWMTPETKLAAHKKLAALNAKIGYPEKWRDYASLVIKADDLVGNYMKSSTFEHFTDTQKIGQVVDKTEWGMTPQTINAYYHPVRNEIVFPAGILQPPFFDMDADDAVNYGAIGAVIGHEIGHSFDDQGSKYDGLGNLRSWWTKQDREAFDTLGKKLVAQFNQFEPIEGQKVNGELTLGENIGDLAGVTIGYLAYQISLNGKEALVIDGLSGAQRFFMGYAQVWRGKSREDALRSQLLSDPHSPGEFRVNGIVGHVDAFYTAFDIEEGDAMYIKPEDRIKIW